jgi:arylsulfatase A-like enzyme
MFEGGHRVVSMISHPRSLPRGEVREQFVTGCDWMPTLCELTGATPPNRRLDGKSMVPILHSATAASEHSWFHWQLGKQWAVREGDWKLIGNPIDSSHKAPITPADKLFLSNLSRDVSEMTNLAQENPQVVARLSSLHEKWQRDVKDRS